MSRFAALLCFLACALGAGASASEGLWFLCFLFVVLLMWSASEYATARRDRALLLADEPAATSFPAAVLMHVGILLQRGKSIYIKAKGRLL